MNDVYVYDFETHKGGIVMDMIRQHPNMFDLSTEEAYNIVSTWYNLEKPVQNQPNFTAILQNPAF